LKTNQSISLNKYIIFSDRKGEKLVKLSKLVFSLGIIIILLSMTVSASAYKANNELIVLSYSDAPLKTEGLNPGDNFTVTVVIKNFLDDPITNVNVSISIPSGMKIIGSPFGLMTEVGEINQTEPFVYHMPTGSELTIQRGYANGSHLEFSFDEMLNGTTKSFSYTANASVVRTYNISPPTITYLDHWGDDQTFNQGNMLSVAIIDFSQEDLLQRFYPSFDVDSEPNWWVLSFLLAGVSVIAVVSKVVYRTNPFT
jgi:uncharacterized repeat protein (TIGR01451 family)